MSHFALLQLCVLSGIVYCSSDVLTNSSENANGTGSADCWTMCDSAATSDSPNFPAWKIYSIIGGSVAVLVVITVTMATTLVCCCRKKEATANTEVEDHAFSNINYDLLVGDERTAVVDKDGLPVGGAPLNNDTRPQQILHTQGVIAGTYLERPRAYSTSIEQEDQDASIRELSYESVNQRFSRGALIRPHNESSDSIPIEVRHDGAIAQSYENPIASLQSDTEGLNIPPSMASQCDSLYRHPGSSEESLYHQLQQMNKDATLSNAQVALGKYIGSGQFGEVYEGVWLSSSNTLNAAIKTLRDNATKDDKIRFLQEAAIMGQFQHPNVVSMYGVVNKNGKILIAMELLQKDNLLIHLKSLRDQEVDCSLLLGYCKHVICGMEYLSGLGFIHRDLAARNILLTKASICKIADFGMSRDLMDGSYYIAHGGKIPVKWTAPEALNFQKYSTASDVWSYGIVLYEIWSLGVKPFERVTNRQVLNLLESGYRLAPPPGCPRAIYKVMIECWHPDAKKRPTFKRLVEVLFGAESELMAWAEADTPLYPQAKKLGASLPFGQILYKDLQKLYVDKESEMEDILYEPVEVGSYSGSSI